jgi:hypothetical protein
MIMTRGKTNMLVREVLKMEAGRWKMEAGSWRLEARSWKPGVEPLNLPELPGHDTLPKPRDF